MIKITFENEFENYADVIPENTKDYETYNSFWCSYDFFVQASKTLDKFIGEENSQRHTLDFPESPLEFSEYDKMQMIIAMNTLYMGNDIERKMGMEYCYSYIVPFFEQLQKLYKEGKIAGYKSLTMPVGLVMNKKGLLEPIIPSTYIHRDRVEFLIEEIEKKAKPSAFLCVYEIFKGANVNNKMFSRYGLYYDEPELSIEK